MRDRSKETLSSIAVKIGLLLLVVFISTAVTWQIAIRTFSGDQYLLTKEQFARFSKYQKMDEIIGSVNKNYYGTVDESSLIEGAYEGLIMGLNDPYSEYLTKEEMEEIDKYNSGSFFGVGIVFNITKDLSYPIVRSVYKDSPAEKAGIQVDDYITKVDGVSTKDLSSDKLVAMVTGEKGTTVKITVVRGRQEVEYEMERAEIQSEVISSSVLEDNIGYVRLFTFSGKSSEKLIQEFKDLQARGCTTFILDLRNNGGGLLDQAVKIADFFMPKGNIVYTQNKNGVEKVYESDSSAFGKKLVVLVNENTASASEIVSGAIQVSGSGKIVGERTYGKGVVQSFHPLTDGNSSIKLTTATYYFANGETPHGKGIEPDYEVEMDQVNIGREENDIQLLKAIEVCKE